MLIQMGTDSPNFVQQPPKFFVTVSLVHSDLTLNNKQNLLSATGNTSETRSPKCSLIFSSNAC